ncbi:MAG: hypothetical protein K8R54_07035 [Bacteroidales bacterium]|nr:hypothetical protein [Bacteroidales bacterium]
MKLGIISVIISVAGIVFVLWYNYETYLLYNELFNKFNSDTGDMTVVLVTVGYTYKLTALFSGLSAIILGILSVRNKSNIGIFGIILSIVLIITAFIPFHVFFR